MDEIVEKFESTEKRTTIVVGGLDALKLYQELLCVAKSAIRRMKHAERRLDEIAAENGTLPDADEMPI